MAAQELAAVAGAGRLLAAQIDKSRARGEVRSPRIACEQRAGRRVELGHDERRRLRAVGSQRPLHERGDRQPPRSPRAVAQAQPRDLDAIDDRNVLQQVQFDAVRVALVATVALAVADHVITVGVAGRQRGGGPQPAVLVVANVQHLLRRIADWVVGPRRQRVPLAVQGPRIATASLGGGEAEFGIGDHIEPGHRWQTAIADDRHEFAAVIVETAIAVEVFQPGFDGSGLDDSRVGRSIAWPG